jgi:tetratricopeptide (TPR) repeat protein
MKKHSGSLEIMAPNSNPLRGSQPISGAVKRRLFCAFFSLAVLMGLANPATSAQQPEATIQGIVRDSAGNPVADASVRLEQRGVPGAIETKTDAVGTYAYSALGLGSFLLTAEKSGMRSRPRAITTSSIEDHLQIDLTLEPDSATSNSHATPSPMEFADAPNFTVAAVTDWTAAGGHGSDSSLRTSEALTRETLTLKPQGSGADPAGSVKSGATEEALRAALAKSPGKFDTNRELGDFYLHAGKYQEAVPLLQTAYQIDPKNEANEFDLALALKGSGDFAKACAHVDKLMAHRETADLNRLAGELAEKLGDPLTAVHRFEQAVREDPNEQNYFEWGSELLLHRAVLQAKDVFVSGAKLYPKSLRMLTALGAALFAGAFYDDAALRLCDASDLNPANPEPYLFMGKIEVAAPNPLKCVEQKLARFVELQPTNPLANYYYAMTLWKQQGLSIDQKALERVETMLTKALTIDPQCSDAYLQLGNLNASRHDYAKAIGFYRKAIETNPQLSEAHYRLGVAYDRVGDRAKATEQFQLHDEIGKQQAAAVDRQRREVKQFLVVVPDKPADSSPSPQ